MSHERLTLTPPGPSDGGYNSDDDFLPRQEWLNSPPLHNHQERLRDEYREVLEDEDAEPITPYINQLVDNIPVPTLAIKEAELSQIQKFCQDIMIINTRISEYQTEVTNMISTEFKKLYNTHIPLETAKAQVDLFKKEIASLKTEIYGLKTLCATLSADGELKSLLTCIICLSEQRCIAFKNCGHLLLCRQCYLRLIDGFNFKCPMCRKMGAAITIKWV